LILLLSEIIIFKIILTLIYLLIADLKLVMSFRSNTI